MEKRSKYEDTDEPTATKYSKAKKYWFCRKQFAMRTAYSNAKFAINNSPTGRICGYTRDCTRASRLSCAKFATRPSTGRAISEITKLRTVLYVIESNAKFVKRLSASRTP